MKKFIENLNLENKGLNENLMKYQKIFEENFKEIIEENCRKYEEQLIICEKENEIKDTQIIDLRISFKKLENIMESQKKAIEIREEKLTIYHEKLL